MAVIEGNTTTITWGSVISDAPITSISFSSGGRSEVEVVTSGGKYSLAGKRNPRKLSVSMILDDPTKAELDTAMTTCAPASLTIHYTPCGGSKTSFFTDNAWITSYSISGDIDGVMTVDVNFLIEE